MSSDPVLLARPTEASGAGDRFLVIAEALTDRLNPILVKEMRQALKSRQFVVTFMLLLIVAWLVSAGTAVFATTEMEFGSAGNSLFLTYFGILAFAVFVIVPFGAHRSMLAERDQNTYELLSISTLTPRQIVNGKLLSAMVQSFVYYSAITPFIAFASLLQGFDLPLSLFLLVAAFCWSICVSMFTLMLSTLARQRQLRAANSMGMFFLLMFQLYTTAGVIFGSGVSGMPFDDPAFWWSVGCVIATAGSYTLLAQQIAVSRLTFESGNRSTGIRVILAAQFWLFCGTVVGYSLWSGLSLTSLSAREARELVVVVAVHWCVAGLFAATEIDWLSRRLRRQLPRNAVLRLLLAPWLPGGARGLVWMLLHVAVILAVAFLVEWDDDWLPAYVMASCCYLVVFTGLGAVLTRWLHAVTPSFKPAHGRVLMLLVLVAMSIAPLIVRAFSTRLMRSEFLTVDLLSPFLTVPRLANEGYAAATDSGLDDRILLSIGAAAVTALLLNTKAMFHGIREVVAQTPGTPTDTSSAVVDAQKELQ
ncbi:MAG: ABC transporter permease [Planctomycetota bacterium]